VFENFVYDVYYNRIEPFVKSEPLPTEPHQNGLITLVGRNIDEIVNQPGHEYFIMFYADWNPRCKKMRLELEELANGHFKGTNIHFAQMDINRNYVPKRFAVQELPTTYFVKESVQKKPMIYKKTLGSVQEFIEKYSDVYNSIPKTKLSSSSNKKTADL
jgi:thiol-disulfide isomerase/thioredoxin